MEIKAGKVGGWKMWRCDNALRTISFKAEGEGAGCRVEEKIWMRVEARRGILKWCKGSMRIIAFEEVGAERAVAMMRVTKEVFPEPEGW